MSSEILQPLTHKLRALEIKQTARMLIVSIARQELFLFADDKLARRFTISTSSKPPSCLENSFGTPTGLHRIAEKLGDGEPLGTVFKGRKSVGQAYRQLSPDEQQPNLVTTRILWLTGLEPGRNQGPGHDSYQRYIYIHGTNHEDKLGKPASGGCIQLANREMIELYDQTAPGDLVYIES